MLSKTTENNGELHESEQNLLDSSLHQVHGTNLPTDEDILVAIIWSPI